MVCLESSHSSKEEACETSKNITAMIWGRDEPEGWIWEIAVRYNWQCLDSEWMQGRRQVEDPGGRPVC